MNNLRVAFAGTPDFAMWSLQEIYNNKFNIVAVFTNPDRKSGRGKKITKSPIKVFAEEKNLTIYQPEKISECEDLIKSLNIDVIIVVAFGQILPQNILDIPKYGCFNIHASLLPRWRGAAPIQRAIEAGDKITGIGIMQMDAGLDTGDILLEKTCEIVPNETALTLHDKLANLGKKAVVEVLQNIDNLQPKKQQGNPTYAKKLSKDEAWIHWENDAKDIYNQIRAFNPYPICQTYFNDNKILKIIDAELVESVDNITQTKTELIITAKNGAISLKTVQVPGKKAVNIKDFNNAYKIKEIY